MHWQNPVPGLDPRIITRGVYTPAFCWFFLYAALAHLKMACLYVSYTNSDKYFNRLKIELVELQIMVGWARQLYAGRFLGCDRSNLVQFTTQRLDPLCGDLPNHTQGGLHDFNSTYSFYIRSCFQ